MARATSSQVVVTGTNPDRESATMPCGQRLVSEVRTTVVAPNGEPHKGRGPRDPKNVAALGVSPPLPGAGVLCASRSVRLPAGLTVPECGRPYACLVSDRYGTDVLSGDWGAPRGGRAVPTEAETGLVVEDVETGYVGAIVRVEKAGGMQVVHLEDRRGRTRGFPLGPGFLLDGRPVVLTPPTAAARAALAEARARTARTASGSRAVASAPARVAAGSRIFVEGRHDAELVEKIWGDDLRVEGVVVELLEGVDDLSAVIRDFAPSRERRMGVLVDHLVPGTKEDRIVRAARQLPQARWVKVLGHPYVDVWQSVRAARLGLDAWPVIERGRPWKQSVLAELGWAHTTQADVARGWKQILATVRSYSDLEPSLLSSVEELIDFVTVPQED